MSDDRPAGLSLRDGLDLSGMSLTELWLRYVGIGGSEGPSDLDRLVRGASSATNYQHNLVAQAINEHFIEQGQDHPVGYQLSQTDLDTTI